MATVSANESTLVSGAGALREVAPDPTTSWPAGCPALGMVGDRATYYLVPSAAHVCYAEGEARLSPTRFQEAYCLSGSYGQCPVWQGREHLKKSLESRAVQLVALSAMRTATVARATAAGLVLLAVGTGVFFFWHGQSGEDVGRTASTAAVAAARTDSGATSPQPAPQPALVAPPPNIAPALHTISRAFTSALTAPVFRGYTVRAGDSLSALAAQFQMSVPALAQANNLAPTAGLTIGQKLLIPAGAGR
jgi:hypothetical protein